MTWIERIVNLVPWLIPALPVLAAGVIAVMPRRRRILAATAAIGAMALSLLLSLWLFQSVVVTFLRLGDPRFDAMRADWMRVVDNFAWFQIGSEWVRLGWVIDPLTSVMLVMVTLASLLIFIYSVGYMRHDENFTRFFCFLSLFGGAMLGVVIANSLLLLFICWELVGLTSYLLIGFWYHKPSAAAAAKKAFITTRVGDLAFLLGMVWLYSQTGTLLFYDNGAGCLEHSALTAMATQSTFLGMAVSTGIALLIFCGAVGKSGQVPLHVWLPDAMEGPTPVSALIHAATMVAAGVFLVARVYPLMSVHIGPDTVTTALKVVAWVGAITAVFAASIAVAQNDIKRILAYSTISQLGYMMLGLGVGGVAVGMFHLIAHAFFKALLFMGAGSVIHGCGEEQNIRRMGGLRKYMPLTFATYAVGMLALCGFPLVFSGFWSKDAILHAASIWSVSRVPFYLGIIGALLTAFYMTRQVCYVFFGKLRLTSEHDSASSIPHESPAVMTVPLVVLAILAILFGFVGTPAWPWFNSFLEGRPLSFDWQGFHEPGVLHVMWTSTVIVLFGFFVGWWWYGRKPEQNPDAPDRYERIRPRIFHVLQNAYFVDQLYRTTFVRLTYWFAHVCDWFDRWIWGGAVWLVSSLVLMFSGLTRTMDNVVVNGGFDRGTDGITFGSRALARLQGGRAQSYLRILGLAFAVLVLILLWGHHG